MLMAPFGAALQSNHYDIIVAVSQTKTNASVALLSVLNGRRLSTSFSPA